jgi:hypothetical protein
MQITKEILERRIGELAEVITKATGALNECEQMLKFVEKKEPIDTVKEIETALKNMNDRIIK